MSSYFDTVAPRWDELRAGYFDESVRQAAIARAKLGLDVVVADIGTGTGFMALGLAPLVRWVVAVDASEAMLRQAQANLGAAGLTNVELRRADGLNLPLEDGSMDAVFANMYLHHIEEPPLALAEIVRVLRLGGRLIITDADAHDREWMRQEMADVWLGFERDLIRRWFVEAGLQDVVVECTGSNCCATSSEGDEAAISVFVAVGVKP